MAKVDRRDRITPEHIAKYVDLTRRALEKAVPVAPERSHLFRITEDFLRMARSYHQDAKHFVSQGDIVNAFASVNYAHGWLDAGVRLGLFDVGLDDELFTLAE